MVESRYPKNHGWQSQVVHQMQVDGRLDEYWKKNSITSTSSDSKLSPPKTVTDNRLAPVLEAAVAEFLPTMNELDHSFSIQQGACESAITLTEGVHAVLAMARFKQENIDSAHLHIGELNTHIENFRLEIGHLIAEREAFRNSISWRATRGLRLIDKSINRWLSKFRK
jgi:hypothetical protein